MDDMQPYYDDGSVTLYHGDCREIIEWLSADVMVTDPPYGVAYISNVSKYGSTRPIVDDHDTGVRDAALSLWGVRPALVFGSWRARRPAACRQLLVWDKGNIPAAGDLTMPWGHSSEEIYVLGAGFHGKRRSNVLRVDRLVGSDADRPAHPTPKPIGLMCQLIAYCPAGVIADPFAGSGSTLVAAKNLGRRAIGVEIEERYCEIAAKRLAQEVLPLDAA
jgi:site-specific DNA-methyltransferase (adenine-specific)